MAGYLFGSKAWAKYVTERLTKGADLLARQKELNLSDDEIKRIAEQHNRLVRHVNDYLIKNSTDQK